MTIRDPLASDVAAIAGIDAVHRILQLVCRTTGMGFSAVAHVTEDRWIACAVRDEIAFGLQPGGELEVATTLCHEVRAARELIVIDDVATDDIYCRHPTPQIYGFKSYISVPIELPDGRFFGTLCAIDPKPARLNSPEVIDMFRLFAELVGFHIVARVQLAAAQQDLLDERRIAELRDQFIAVLGHDLRNPLNAIQAGAAVLGATEPPAPTARAVSVIRNSAARMAALIDNVLDFARGKLGGGLRLRLSEESHLADELDEVVAELRAASPERKIVTTFAIDRPVVYERARLAQLLSNLLANALTHGDPRFPVEVRVSTDDDGLTLAVSNGGDPIPEEKLERLFQPFSRAEEGAGQEGLGLGLYIAAEIARAHRGTLNVSSTPAATVFTFRMPHLRPNA